MEPTSLVVLSELSDRWLLLVLIITIHCQEVDLLNPDRVGCVSVKRVVQQWKFQETWSLWCV